MDERRKDLDKQEYKRNTMSRVAQEEEVEASSNSALQEPRHHAMTESAHAIASELVKEVSSQRQRSSRQDTKFQDRSGTVTPFASVAQLDTASSHSDHAGRIRTISPRGSVSPSRYKRPLPRRSANENQETEEQDMEDTIHRSRSVTPGSFAVDGPNIDMRNPSHAETTRQTSNTSLRQDSAETTTMADDAETDGHASLPVALPAHVVTDIVVVDSELVHPSAVEEGITRSGVDPGEDDPSDHAAKRFKVDVDFNLCVVVACVLLAIVSGVAIALGVALANSGDGETKYSPDNPHDFLSNCMCRQYSQACLLAADTAEVWNDEQLEGLSKAWVNATTTLIETEFTGGRRLEDGVTEGQGDSQPTIEQETEEETKIEVLFDIDHYLVLTNLTGDDPDYHDSSGFYFSYHLSLCEVNASMAELSFYFFVYESWMAIESNRVEFAKGMQGQEGLEEMSLLQEPQLESPDRCK